MREVAADIAGDLDEQERALERVLSGDLAELNALAAELGLPFVASTRPAAKAGPPLD
jgi:hypothetical protein